MCPRPRRATSPFPPDVCAISGATPEEEHFTRVHLIDVLGPENVFVAHATILESMKQALDRAPDHVKEKSTAAS